MARNNKNYNNAIDTLTLTFSKRFFEEIAVIKQNITDHENTGKELNMNRIIKFFKNKNLDATLITDCLTTINVKSAISSTKTINITYTKANKSIVDNIKGRYEHVPTIMTSVNKITERDYNTTVSVLKTLLNRILVHEKVVLNMYGVQYLLLDGKKILNDIIGKNFSLKDIYNDDNCKITDSDPEDVLNCDVYVYKAKPLITLIANKLL